MGSDEEEALSNSLQSFANNLAASIKKGLVIVDGTVVAGSVDETKYTCDITVGKNNPVTFPAVPLRVLLNKKASLIEIPNDAAGSESVVLMTFRDGNMNRPQLLEVDSAKKIIIEIGGSKLEIIDGKFTFNGGTIGLPKADSLVTRLNKIENDITSLKNVFTSWVVVPQDGGAALKAASALWFGTPLQNTVLNNIANDKILQ
jgi:hypothetical protein